MPMVKCDLCGKEFHKNKTEMSRTGHNFCCLEHYNEYRKKHRFFDPGAKSVEYKKIVYLAQMRKNIQLGVIDISQVKKMKKK